MLQGEAVKITHLFRDQKDNEKATEAFNSERTDFYETSGPLPRTEGENLVEDLLTKDVAEQAFDAGEEVPPYARVSTIAGGIYTGSRTLLKDEDIERKFLKKILQLNLKRKKKYLMRMQVFFLQRNQRWKWTRRKPRKSQHHTCCQER